MDAHGTVQRSVAISANMRGLCGPAVATPIRICHDSKLLPSDKRQSPRGIETTQQLCKPAEFQVGQPV